MTLFLIAIILSETPQVLPAWAVALLSIVASTIVTGVVGYIVTRYLDRYFKKKDKAEQELHKKLQENESFQNDKKREQRRADMVEVIKEEINPIMVKIDTLVDKVAKTEDGTLASLRNDILTCYYRCCEKGYRGDWDFENIHHLFDAYKELNGNSFIRDVMDRFDELPSKEEFVKNQKEAAREEDIEFKNKKIK